MEFEYGDIVDEDYISEEYVPFARTSFGNLLLIRLDESEFNGNIYFSNHDLFNSKRINLQYRKYVTHLMNLLIRYIALAIKI